MQGHRVAGAPVVSPALCNPNLIKVFPLTLDNKLWQATPMRPESSMDLAHQEMMKSQVEAAHRVSIRLSLNPVPGSGHSGHGVYQLPWSIYQIVCHSDRARAGLFIGIQHSWATLKTLWPQQLGPFLHVAQIFFEPIVCSRGWSRH